MAGANCSRAVEEKAFKKGDKMPFGHERNIKQDFTQTNSIIVNALKMESVRIYDYSSFSWWHIPTSFPCCRHMSLPSHQPAAHSYTRPHYILQMSHGWGESQHRTMCEGNVPGIQIHQKNLVNECYWSLLAFWLSGNTVLEAVSI